VEVSQAKEGLNSRLLQIFIGCVRIQPNQALRRRNRNSLFP